MHNKTHFRIKENTHTLNAALRSRLNRTEKRDQLGAMLVARYPNVTSESSGLIPSLYTWTRSGVLLHKATLTHMVNAGGWEKDWSIWCDADGRGGQVSVCEAIVYEVELLLQCALGWGRAKYTCRTDMRVWSMPKWTRANISTLGFKLIYNILASSSRASRPEYHSQMIFHMSPSELRSWWLVGPSRRISLCRVLRSKHIVSSSECWRWAVL